VINAFRRTKNIRQLGFWPWPFIFQLYEWRKQVYKQNIINVKCVTGVGIWTNISTAATKAICLIDRIKIPLKGVYIPKILNSMLNNSWLWPCKSITSPLASILYFRKSLCISHFSCIFYYHWMILDKKWHFLFITIFHPLYQVNWPPDSFSDANMTNL
jgi:hypothetical protein